jgi:hypothetical protein
LARRSIKVSVQQVELARFRLEAPPQGVGGGGGTGGTSTAGRSQLGATTARDLTDALNGLLSAQNSFLNVWVTFEVLRRDLDFSLGTIQLDDRGFWIDPGTIDVSIAVACGANISAGTNATFPRTQDVTPPRSAVPVEIRIEPIAPSGTLPVNVPMNQSQWLPEMDVERPGYLPEGESPIGLNLVPRDEGALEESAVAADLFSMPSQLVPKLAPPQSQSPNISAAPENSPAPVSANDWLAAPEIIPTTPAASSPSPNSTRWQSQAKSGQ